MEAGDNAELEALFDSISATAEPAPKKAARPALVAAKAPSASDDADNPELEALFDSIASGSDEPAAVEETAATEHDPENCPANKVINEVGQLTRQLHDTLAELGYDKQIQDAAAAALPDARQRIAYVVKLTEQAASRSLNAVELATPLQDKLAADASVLAGRWDDVFSGAADVEKFKALAAETRDYLHGVERPTSETRAHLQEIMMAQEFQDLTGQVLKRITDLANNLETELLKLLVENVSAPISKPEALNLLNGPALDGDAPDVVANQAQVDELLESLGF
jgi:chemotaxis protein CheZ